MLASFLVGRKNVEFSRFVRTLHGTLVSCYDYFTTVSAVITFSSPSRRKQPHAHVFDSDVRVRLSDVATAARLAYVSCFSCA